MHRSSASQLAVAAALAAFVSLPALTQDAEPVAVPAEQAAATVVDPSWRAPRTPWGDPDLSGLYSTDDMRGVPTQRPQQFGDRESLTPEEFAERAAQQAAGRERAINDETFLRNEWGTRTFGYSSLVVEPADGRVPEMTPAGRARAGARDQGTFGPGPFKTVEDFTLYDRCITRGVIGSTLPVIYGNGIFITQSPDQVAITYEMIHDTRVVPLDDATPPDPAIKQYMGVPRGRWDGDTLVVETTNFTDQTSIGGNGNGTRHSDQLKITETFRRVDPEMIEYTARVEDPVTYTAPFKFRMMFTTQPNYEMYEYACHEANDAVRGTLSGERAWEREVAEAIAAGREPPARSGGNIYGAPDPNADVFSINAGE
jgi:hypothetical protein